MSAPPQLGIDPTTAPQDFPPWESLSALPALGPENKVTFTYAATQFSLLSHRPDTCNYTVLLSGHPKDKGQHQLYAIQSTGLLPTCNSHATMVLKHADKLFDGTKFRWLECRPLVARVDDNAQGVVVNEVEFHGQPVQRPHSLIHLSKELKEAGDCWMAIREGVAQVSYQNGPKMAAVSPQDHCGHTEYYGPECDCGGDVQRLGFQLVPTDILETAVAKGALDGDSTENKSAHTHQVKSADNVVSRWPWEIKEESMVEV